MPKTFTAKHGYSFSVKKELAVIVMILLSLALDAQQRAVYVGVPQEGSGPFKVRGKAFSVATGEPIIGANIYIERQRMGTSTDAEGNYELELYAGAYVIQSSSVGFGTTTRTVSVRGPGSLNFGMKESAIQLEELVVQSAKENQNISSKSVGKNVLNVESIKTLPPLAGEVDVLKSLILLPGVSTQGEVSGGFSVRGGGTDQNLILLGGATLYNPSHLFGFFSSFNASVVRNVSLYKGVVPASYGGRASSVIDVSYRKGNFGHWEGELSLGLVATKFAAGGPVIKDKFSIMTAGRVAYPNWLVAQSNDPNIANSTAAFYDGNIILNYILDDKNDIEYTLYSSGDGFEFANNITNSWRNLAQTVRWNSVINEKLEFHLAGIQTRYNATLGDNSAFSAFDLDTRIVHNEIDAGLTFTASERHKFDVGGQVRFLENNLGEIIPSENSTTLPGKIEPENAIETGIYAQHEFDLTEKLGISYGFRYSTFADRGPTTINVYDPTRPRDLSSVIDSITYGNENVATYQNIEPRVLLKYEFTPTFSFRGGFSQAYQYVHLITNTNSALPTDIWKWSDPFIEPQNVLQYSAGLFKNLNNNRIEISVEGYYKDLRNLVEYKDGADLFFNANLETELVRATGRSYGVEFFVKRTIGRINGWASYTFARSFRQFAGEFDENNINRGEEFPANLDSPHTINTVMNYRLGYNLTFNAIFTYSSGRPFTLPEGKFEYDGIDLAYYGDRNNERGPDIHRLDMSLQFRFPSKQKIWDGQWTLALYNVYGRDNPFSVFFQDIEGSPPQAYKLAIVGSPFPSLSYEVKF